MVEHDSTKIAEIHTELSSHLPSEPALRVKALESLLVEKNLIDPLAIDKWIEAYSEEIGPKRGAKLIARAWVNQEFKDLFLSDAPKAIEQFGFQGWATGHTIVLENTESIHNLVVCTLCSCYPITLLGIPPNWYKNAAYRSRAVRDPRGVLSEFKVELTSNVEVRVWDSTSELRYMVMPQRPDGTEDWEEADLAKIVTRNSMIGTERKLSTKIKEHN